MKKTAFNQQGFSIVELLIGTFVGLILSYAVLRIYIAQTQMAKVSNSQALIQSNENAIANLVSPIIRSAGFTGCGNVSSSVSNLNAGGPNPIGTINTSPTMIKGYNGGTANYNIQTNPSNDNAPGDWLPALDATLTGQSIKYSDVVVVFGSAPGALPISVTNATTGSSSLTIQGANGTTISPGQFAGISDCSKTVIFLVSGVTGTTITHSAGAGTSQNTNSIFVVNFQPGAQFISLQQTAFFVGQGQGGQSALMRAVLVGNAWTVQPMIPGVEMFKVQYGIGANGVITQYVTADAVTNWAQVYSIRMAFLIAGQQGSGFVNNAQTYTLLNTTVTAPADNRLRHVFEMTVNLRNALI